MSLKLSIPRQYITAEILSLLKECFEDAASIYKAGVECETPVLLFGNFEPAFYHKNISLDMVQAFLDTLKTKEVPFDLIIDDTISYFRPKTETTELIDISVNHIDENPVISIFEIKKSLDKPLNEAMAEIKDTIEKHYPSFEKLEDKWCKTIVPFKSNNIEVDLDRFSGIL